MPKNKNEPKITIDKPFQILFVLIVLISIIIQTVMILSSLRYTSDYKQLDISWLQAYGALISSAIMAPLLFIIPYFMQPKSISNLHRLFLSGLWYAIGTAFLSFIFYPLPLLGFVYDIISGSYGLMVTPIILVIYTVIIYLWIKKFKQ